MSASERWTDDEFLACVQAYAKLLRDQSQGSGSAKKQFLDDLAAGPMKNRTRASIEYRMGNISAVLDDAGHPFATGYVPMRNVGRISSEKIRHMLRNEGLI